MTRIGSNPARGKVTRYRPSSVTACMLTYLPNREGYFRGKLDVIRLALSSLIETTPAGTDILVFDNGSCAALTDHLMALRASGQIDYLFLSGRNIGKVAALRLLCQAAPGDWIAYADDDILFYPGWLEAHQAVFEALPQVGMVSGTPVRNANTYARTALDRYLAQPPSGVEIRRGRVIPDEWENDWARSTGRDPAAHLESQAEREDVLIRAGEVETIGGANHFQYLARKADLLQAFPSAWSGRLMGQMREIDEALDAAGRLRLATRERCARHIGNQLGEADREEARRLGLDLQHEGRAGRIHRHWLLRIPGMGRLLRWTYNKLFNIIFEVD